MKVRQGVKTETSAANSSVPNTKNLYIDRLSDREIYIKLNQLEKERYEADYTGMTDVEIYLSVKARYEEAFGKDFEVRTKEYMGVPSFAQECAVCQYGRVLNDIFGSNVSKKDVIRQGLYGDMSPTEVKTAISSKYPSGKEMTLQN